MAPPVEELDHADGTRRLPEIPAMRHGGAPWDEIGALQETGDIHPPRCAVHRRVVHPGRPLGPQGIAGMRLRHRHGQTVQQDCRGGAGQWFARRVKGLAQRCPPGFGSVQQRHVAALNRRPVLTGVARPVGGCRDPKVREQALVVSPCGQQVQSVDDGYGAVGVPAQNAALEYLGESAVEMESSRERRANCSDPAQVQPRRPKTRTPVVGHGKPAI